MNLPDILATLVEQAKGRGLSVVLSEGRDARVVAAAITLAQD